GRYLAARRDLARDDARRGRDMRAGRRRPHPSDGAARDARRARGGPPQPLRGAPARGRPPSPRRRRVRERGRLPERRAPALRRRRRGRHGGDRRPGEAAAGPAPVLVAAPPPSVLPPLDSAADDLAAELGAPGLPPEPAIAGGAPAIAGGAPVDPVRAGPPHR